MRTEYRCIGHHRINNRRNDRTELVQCEKESETPSNPDKPEWGYICADCANELPHARKEYEEPDNLGAAQCDPAEFRDQIAAGFASGARRGYEDSTDGDDE